MKSREAFEAYFADSRRNRGPGHAPTFDLRSDGTYADDHTQRHWWTWQCAQQARDAEVDWLHNENNLMAAHQGIDNYQRLVDEIAALRDLVADLCPPGIEQGCDECGGDPSMCKANQPTCPYPRARMLLAAIDAEIDSQRKPT
jgi:hypothetical protein